MVQKGKISVMIRAHKVWVVVSETGFIDCLKYAEAYRAEAHNAGGIGTFKTVINSMIFKNNLYFICPIHARTVIPFTTLPFPSY